ncbi:MAG: hypothetical protein RBU29_00205 [bacterium]|jgi:hypothetical protein|nr:hypothetical protein [bacterium]
MDQNICAEILSKRGRDLYSFSNEPVRVDEDRYKHLMEDLIHEARRLAGVLSVYMDDITFGHSISQIKLIVVYDSETCDEHNLKFDHVLRTIGTRNLVDEDIVSVDEKLLENLSKFDCLLQPQWVMGKKIEVKYPPQGEIRFFNISRVLDLLCSGFLKDFFLWETQRDINTREALWKLKRLRRLVDLTKVILRKENTPRWDTYMETVHTMCDNWFEMGIERYRMLMWSIREGVCILFDLIHELAEYFDRARVVNLKVDPQDSDSNALIVTDRIATHFVKDWTETDAFERMIWCYESLGQFITVLPLTFGMQLYEYAKGHNAFSRYIKSCYLSESISGNMERSYISLERAKILNHYLNFKLALGMPLDDDTIFHCNLRDGSTLAKAANMMNVQKNKARLKRVQRVLRGEEEPISDFVDEG